MSGLNFFERAIAEISPGWGMRRLSERMQLRAMEVRAGHFDAATSGRKANPARSRGSGPNAANAGDAISLRNIARDLRRNSGHAANAVRALSAHAVGTGIVPRFEQGSKLARAGAKDSWARFCDEIEPEGINDFYGQQDVSFQAVAGDGEVLRVWYYSDDRLRCDIREADFLDSSRNEIARDTSGKKIVQGIEYNAKGERIAFHLHKHHPGERGIFTGRYGTDRVEARYVDHMLLPDRPGQSRGVSIFAPVAQRLKQFNDLSEAMLERRAIETMFALWIERERETGGAFAATGQATPASDGGSPVEDLESGSIMYGRPGERPHPVSISSPGDSWQFAMIFLHEIAAGLGIPYHVLTHDVSQANYTSQRAAISNFNAHLDRWQGRLMVRQFNRRAWLRFVEFDTYISKRSTRGLANVRPIWIPPARTFVDPKKDLEALVEEINAGLKSPQDAIIARGRDPEETQRERSEWAKAEEKLGLKSESKGRKKKASDDADDDDKTE